MRIAWSRNLHAALGVVLCSLTACSVVAFRNPPAGDPSAQHLLGLWRVDWEATDPEKKRTDRPKVVIAIGKKRGSADLLEAVSVSFKGDMLDVDRGELSGTTIAGRSYASVRQPSSVHYDEYWFILRYEALEEGGLRVFLMNEPRVSADVRAKIVSGTVNEPNASVLPGWVPVEVTAGPGPLRTYLEQRGDEIFSKDQPLVLRRVKLD